jgi:putative nucleotidyltransferase with HDIG domain
VEHVPWARDLAQRLLAEPLPRRWAHSQGVGRKAESIAHIVGPDAEVLACAAWLHDIGYAPSLAKSGSHALDGARYLRDVIQADSRLCRLVANHTYAIVEARRRCLAEELAAEFPVVDGLVADALVYCDMTTSPDGEPMDVETRLSEISARYGPGDIVSDSIAEVRPRILRSVQSVTGAQSEH